MHGMTLIGSKKLHALILYVASWTGCQHILNWFIYTVCASNFNAFNNVTINMRKYLETFCFKAFKRGKNECQLGASHT